MKNNIQKSIKHSWCELKSVHVGMSFGKSANPCEAAKPLSEFLAMRAKYVLVPRHTHTMNPNAWNQTVFELDVEKHNHKHKDGYN